MKYWKQGEMQLKAIAVKSFEPFCLLAIIFLDLFWYRNIHRLCLSQLLLLLQTIISKVGVVTLSSWEVP